MKNGIDNVASNSNDVKCRGGKYQQMRNGRFLCYGTAYGDHFTGDVTKDIRFRFNSEQRFPPNDFASNNNVNHKRRSSGKKQKSPASTSNHNGQEYTISNNRFEIQVVRDGRNKKNRKGHQHKSKNIEAESVDKEDMKAEIEPILTTIIGGICRKLQRPDIHVTRKDIQATKVLKGAPNHTKKNSLSSQSDNSIVGQRRSQCGFPSSREKNRKQSEACGTKQHAIRKRPKRAHGKVCSSCYRSLALEILRLRQQQDSADFNAIAQSMMNKESGQNRFLNKKSRKSTRLHEISGMPKECIMSTHPHPANVGGVFRQIADGKLLSPIIRQSGKDNTIQVEYYPGLTTIKDNVPTTTKDNVPTARRDDVPAAIKDNVPIVIRDDLPTARRDDVPTAMKDNVPTVRKDNVPTTIGDNVPTTIGDDVPTTIGDNVPTAIWDNVQTAIKDNVPTAIWDNVPTAIKDNVPTAIWDNVPTAIKDNVPIAIKNNVPTTKTDNVQTAIEDNVPTAIEDNVPIAIKDNIPIAIEDNVPTAIKDNVPTTIGDNVPIAIRDEVPTAIKDNVPTTIEDNVPIAIWSNAPTAIEDNVPIAIKDNVPTAIKDNVPTVIWDNAPTAKKDNVPTAIKDNAPTAIKDNVPTAIWGNAPTAIKDNVPDAIKSNLHHAPQPVVSQSSGTVYQLTTEDILRIIALSKDIDVDDLKPKYDKKSKKLSPPSSAYEPEILEPEPKKSKDVSSDNSERHERYLRPTGYLSEVGNEKWEQIKELDINERSSDIETRTKEKFNLGRRLKELNPDKDAVADVGQFAEEQPPGSTGGSEIPTDVPREKKSIFKKIKDFVRPKPKGSRKPLLYDEPGAIHQNFTQDDMFETFGLNKSSTQPKPEPESTTKTVKTSEENSVETLEPSAISDTAKTSYLEEEKTVERVLTQEDVFGMYGIRPNETKTPSEGKGSEKEKAPTGSLDRALTVEDMYDMFGIRENENHDDLEATVEETELPVFKKSPYFDGRKSRPDFLAIEDPQSEAEDNEVDRILERVESECSIDGSMIVEDTSSRELFSSDEVDDILIHLVKDTSITMDGPTTEPIKLIDTTDEAYLEEQRSEFLSEFRTSSVFEHVNEEKRFSKMTLDCISSENAHKDNLRNKESEEMNVSENLKAAQESPTLTSKESADDREVDAKKNEGKKVVISDIMEQPAKSGNQTSMVDETKENLDRENLISDTKGKEGSHTSKQAVHDDVARQSSLQDTTKDTVIQGREGQPTNKQAVHDDVARQSSKQDTTKETTIQGREGQPTNKQAVHDDVTRQSSFQDTTMETTIQGREGQPTSKQAVQDDVARQSSKQDSTKETTIQGNEGQPTNKQAVHDDVARQSSFQDTTKETTIEGREGQPTNKQAVHDDVARQSSKQDTTKETTIEGREGQPANKQAVQDDVARQSSLQDATKETTIQGNEGQPANKQAVHDDVARQSSFQDTTKDTVIQGREGQPTNKQAVHDDVARQSSFQDTTKETAIQGREGQPTSEQAVQDDVTWQSSLQDITKEIAIQGNEEQPTSKQAAQYDAARQISLREGSNNVAVTQGKQGAPTNEQAVQDDVKKVSLQEGLNSDSVPHGKEEAPTNKQADQNGFGRAVKHQQLWETATDKMEPTVLKNAPLQDRSIINTSKLSMERDSAAKPVMDGTHDLPHYSEITSTKEMIHPRMQKDTLSHAEFNKDSSTRNKERALTTKPATHGDLYKAVPTHDLQASPPKSKVEFLKDTLVLGDEKTFATKSAPQYGFISPVPSQRDGTPRTKGVVHAGQQKNTPMLRRDPRPTRKASEDAFSKHSRTEAEVGTFPKSLCEFNETSTNIHPQEACTLSQYGTGNIGFVNSIITIPMNDLISIQSGLSWANQLSQFIPNQSSDQQELDQSPDISNEDFMLPDDIFGFDQNDLIQYPLDNIASPVSEDQNLYQLPELEFEGGRRDVASVAGVSTQQGDLSDFVQLPTTETAQSLEPRSLSSQMPPMMAPMVETSVRADVISGSADSQGLAGGYIEDEPSPLTDDDRSVSLPTCSVYEEPRNAKLVREFSKVSRMTPYPTSNATINLHLVLQPKTDNVTSKDTRGRDKRQSGTAEDLEKDNVKSKKLKASASNQLKTASPKDQPTQSTFSSARDDAVTSPVDESESLSRDHRKVDDDHSQDRRTKTSLDQPQGRKVRDNQLTAERASERPSRSSVIRRLRIEPQESCSIWPAPMESEDLRTQQTPQRQCSRSQHMRRTQTSSREQRSRRQESISETHLRTLPSASSEMQKFPTNSKEVGLPGSDATRGTDRDKQDTWQSLELAVDSLASKPSVLSSNEKLQRSRSDQNVKPESSSAGKDFHGSTTMSGRRLSRDARGFKKISNQQKPSEEPILNSLESPCVLNLVDEPMTGPPPAKQHRMSATATSESRSKERSLIRRKSSIVKDQTKPLVDHKYGLGPQSPDSDSFTAVSPSIKVSPEHELKLQQKTVPYSKSPDMFDSGRPVEPEKPLVSYVCSPTPSPGGGEMDQQRPPVSYVCSPQASQATSQMDQLRPPVSYVCSPQVSQAASQMDQQRPPVSYICSPQASQATSQMDQQRPPVSYICSPQASQATSQMDQLRPLVPYPNSPESVGHAQTFGLPDDGDSSEQRTTKSRSERMQDTSDRTAVPHPDMRRAVVSINASDHVDPQFTAQMPPRPRSIRSDKRSSEGKPVESRGSLAREMAFQRHSSGTAADISPIKSYEFFDFGVPDSNLHDHGAGEEHNLVPSESATLEAGTTASSQQANPRANSIPHPQTILSSSDPKAATSRDFNWDSTFKGDYGPSERYAELYNEQRRASTADNGKRQLMNASSSNDLNECEKNGMLDVRRDSQIDTSIPQTRVARSSSKAGFDPSQTTETFFSPLNTDALQTANRLSNTTESTFPFIGVDSTLGRSSDGLLSSLTSKRKSTTIQESDKDLSLSKQKLMDDQIPSSDGEQRSTNPKCGSSFSAFSGMPCFHVSAQGEDRIARRSLRNVNPVDVDPVNVDPVNVDPVNVDPVDVDPVDVDPVDVDPVNVDPVNVDPVKVNRVKVNPVKANPVDLMQAKSIIERCLHSRSSGALTPSFHPVWAEECGNTIESDGIIAGLNYICTSTKKRRPNPFTLQFPIDLEASKDPAIQELEKEEEKMRSETETSLTTATVDSEDTLTAKVVTECGHIRDLCTCTGRPSYRSLTMGFVQHMQPTFWNRVTIEKGVRDFRSIARKLEIKERSRVP